MSYCSSFCGLLCLLGAGLLAAPATAQIPAAPDTTRLSYGEEVAAPPAAPVPLRVGREERRLWKLGLNNVGLNISYPDSGTSYFRYGVHLAYERKLSRPAWSVLAEVSPAITRSRTSGSSPQYGLSVRTQLAGRYYYNLERRLRKGRSGNFSANYVTLVVGTGLGPESRETPFYFFPRDGRWVKVDAGLLYGLQRRLGRYGFLDFNIGISSLVSSSTRRLDLLGGGSLRLGFVLGALPAENTASQPVPPSVDDGLRPKVYIGQLTGSYTYRLHYSLSNPYRRPQVGYNQGVGIYDHNVTGLYYCVGYYLNPRLAVQLGVQVQSSADNTILAYDAGYANRYIYDKNWALPTLLCYSITRNFRQRVQFDAVGGLVPVWSSVTVDELDLNYKEPIVENHFVRRTFGMYATLGLNMSYGIGHRRRVQITSEWVAIKDLRISSQAASSIQPGGSVGLRYRFGYHYH